MRNISWRRVSYVNKRRSALEETVQCGRKWGSTVFVLFSQFLPSLPLTCAFLADVGQVVVAGHIVPFAVLMGDHHHTVLSTRKEIIRLVLPPVLILLEEERGYFRAKSNPMALLGISCTILYIHCITNGLSDTPKRSDIIYYINLFGA